LEVIRIEEEEEFVAIFMMTSRYLPRRTQGKFLYKLKPSNSQYETKMIFTTSQFSCRVPLF